LRDNDPCIQFGEIDADATFAGTGTHVNSGPVLGLTQTSLQLRLRLMTDGALVRKRRTVVGAPHGEPSRHLVEPRLERRDFTPATLMRLAAGAGREAQERNPIVLEACRFRRPRRFNRRFGEPEYASAARGPSRPRTISVVSPVPRAFSPRRGLQPSRPSRRARYNDLPTLHDLDSALEAASSRWRF
jgi:hypothetical protein